MIEAIHDILIRKMTGMAFKYFFYITSLNFTVTHSDPSLGFRQTVTLLFKEHKFYLPVSEWLFIGLLNQNPNTYFLIH